MSSRSLCVSVLAFLPALVAACSCPSQFPHCQTGDGWCYDSSALKDWCDTGEDAKCSTSGCGAYSGSNCTGDAVAAAAPPPPAMEEEEAAPPPPVTGCYATPASGGCSGRNELMVTSGLTVEQCEAACDADCRCVSYEFDGDSCHLSSSCTNKHMEPSDGSSCQLYLKEATCMCSPPPLAPPLLLARVERGWLRGPQRANGRWHRLQPRAVRDGMRRGLQLCVVRV